MLRGQKSGELMSVFTVITLALNYKIEECI